MLEMCKGARLLMTVDLLTLNCNRCGHNWHPRTEKLPSVCPKCKSPYWNKERKLDESVQKDAKE